MGLWSSMATKLVQYVMVRAPTELLHSSKRVSPSGDRSCTIYGPQWKGKTVLFVVDNTAVVEVLKSTFCRDSHLMHLIHLLVFLASYHNFCFTAKHIAGRVNTLADALSRNNMSFFYSQVPQAPQERPQIPEAISHLTGTGPALDIHCLDSAVQHYYSAALAASTQKIYKAAECRYLDFCMKFSISPCPHQNPSSAT